MSRERESESSVGLNKAWPHSMSFKGITHCKGLKIIQAGSGFLWYLGCNCRDPAGFQKTKNDGSHCFVVFQSPSWGTAAPPPPIACTPSCTSTLAPSRSPPSAGHTASLAAPWGPSWQCHAMAVVWVRHTHTHMFTHLHTRKEVSSRRADGIQEQTGNVSQSWYFHPAS